jgi:uncharacterized protein YdiU (UPF0061 family)
MMNGWRLEHSYSALPALFHARVQPTPVKSPRLVIFNRPLARALGLDDEALDGPTGAGVFSGNVAPEGAFPLAQAYAGHQFGHFATLGDGRAILLGEQCTPDGARVDIQLKGPGPTPYSRRGDGRAALGPMLREYLISEAMHGLGIPTSRSLAVVATGEPVFRERVLPGAVLTRVAASHLRVGTFEWAAAHRDRSALAALADYTASRHYPDTLESAHRHLDLLRAIARRQAALIALWQGVGFVHGVMNTDNMALSGETIDYGPCAFMDTYHPATRFSSIDHHGRYAYGNQPSIGQWNIARLAEAMLPLLDDDQERAVSLASDVVEGFADEFEARWRDGMRGKLGLISDDAEDASLVDELLTWMEQQKADFTNTFRALSTADLRTPAVPDESFRPWQERWLARLQRQPESIETAQEMMRRFNPAVIPRNHHVENALESAGQDDLAPLRQLLDALAAPYDRSRDGSAFTTPPAAGEPFYRTFCGT